MTYAVSNLYSIRQAAHLSGLPASTLRYYEDIGLVGRIERDVSSGHRRYSATDIDLAVAIACLSAAGMSIEEMRTYLANRDQGNAAATGQIALLEQQRQRLAQQGRDLAIRQRYIEHKLRYWQAVRSGDGDARAAASVKVKQIAAALHERRTSNHTNEERE